MGIITFILVFIVGWVIDLFVYSVDRKEVDKLCILEKNLKKYPKYHKRFEDLYGKEFDEIMNKTPGDFPLSLFFNLKEVYRVQYLQQRIMSFISDVHDYY